MQEIWKDIKGYEGLYQVSNLGRIKSLNFRGNNKEGLLKPCKNSDGYLNVRLYKDGNGKTLKVHRFVAEAFLSNPDNLPQVNHKDEDKTNNCVDNLEWCDIKYNCNYGTRTERMLKNRNDESRPIYQFDSEGIFIKKWDSAKQIEEETGYFHTAIYGCCTNKYLSAYNFYWQYSPVFKNVQTKHRKKILQFDLDNNFIKEWPSTREVERVLNICHSHITNCCKTKYGYKTCGGYIWRYKEGVAD